MTPTLLCPSSLSATSSVVEDALSFVLWDPDPVVLDADLDHVAEVLRRQADGRHEAVPSGLGVSLDRNESLPPLPVTLEVVLVATR